MGHRLSKIYTRTGDQGDTGLADGSRISKTSLRIEVMGTFDELNSAIGLVIAHIPQEIKDLNKIQGQEATAKILLQIQHDLFDIGGEICIPGNLTISERRVTRLEQQLDTLNENLPWLKEFILPGGNIPAASCHMARSICRRAERLLVNLSEQEAINPASLAYINRLSDLLFVIARTLARSSNGEEIFWQKDLSENQNQESE